MGFKLSSTARALLGLWLTATVGRADWIDPDTPYDAMTTTPLNVKPPKLEKQNKKDDDDDDKKSRRRHPETKSPAPTASPVPSAVPSSTPSAYPTFNPKTFELVFSDEFNTPGREFRDGGDPRWTALDKNDYTNDALHYYSPNNVEIDDDGYLVIKTEAEDTDIIGFDDVEQKKTTVTKHFRSAMLQSWNKFCFTGGIIEAEVQLPGKARIGGLWPALWLLGNLARHTYVGSSEHIWPWSSLDCTKKSRQSQKLSGCDHIGHFGMDAFLGRGAPEMDIFEVQAGGQKANQGPFLKTSVGQPFMSASYQVAPGRPSNRPGPGEWPGPGQWYDGLVGGKNTSLNIGFYGNYNHFLSDRSKNQDYWSDAISFNLQLDESYFNQTRVYRLEWDVPTDESDGYLHWFVDDQLVLAIDGKGVTGAGLGSVISTEPSYIIMNTAISKQWGFPQECPTDCKCKEFDCHSTDWQYLCGFSYGFCEMMLDKTPEYKVNWVRVYQDPSNPLHKVGCSTPERPTRRYIEGHPDLYKEEKDAVPIKGIQRGGGRCDPSAKSGDEDTSKTATCGDERHGYCTKGRVCQCNIGWTGPHCLSHQGFDPIQYDQPDSIEDLGFVAPSVVPKFLIGAFVVLFFALLANLMCKRKFDGWTPIPDVDPSMNVRAPGRRA